MRIINIDITCLGQAIKRMETFVKDWSSNDTRCPGTLGGGKTVNELEELAQIYKDLNNLMVSLASNTAEFLSDIKESYEESDRKARWHIFSD